MTDPFVAADESIGHRDSPLNPRHVNEVYDACLCEGDEPCVKVEGILHNAAFALSELRNRHGEITAMLDQLPDEFKPHDKGGGGGWSFLNACNDRDGNQWTSLHLVMERLFLLGIATGQARWLMPRDMWSVFPGGMPYVCIGIAS